MGFTIWFTGMSGSGKTTLSAFAHGLMAANKRHAVLLDGDSVRKILMTETDFSLESREAQVSHLRFASYCLNTGGVASIVAAITPLEAMRTRNRAMLCAYYEIYCECDFASLVQRDAKGLYAKALRGELNNFTGVSSPYEVPTHPDLIVNTAANDIAQSCALVARFVDEKRLLHA